jgi:hypothetical protein
MIRRLYVIRGGATPEPAEIEESRRATPALNASEVRSMRREAVLEALGSLVLVGAGFVLVEWLLVGPVHYFSLGALAVLGLGVVVDSVERLWFWSWVVPREQRRREVDEIARSTGVLR